MNELIKLNKKVETNIRKRRKTLRSLHSTKKSGILYTNNMPDIDKSTAAIAIDLNTYKVFINGDDRWYAIDRFEGTVPEIDKVHRIFVQRKIMFYSLFYYNSTDIIQLPEYMEKEFTEDIIIDRMAGYNLYACYVEVI